MRWLAYLLVVSPLLAGIIAPIVHPCPVDAPWLVTSHEADQNEHHCATEDDHQHKGHSACHCVGSCTGAAVVGTVPPGQVMLGNLPITLVIGAGAAAPDDALTRPRYLLPPSHAPPVV